MSEKHTAENDLPLDPITVTEDAVVQVVLTAPMVEWFQSQIRARGLYLFPMPGDDEDLPTFGVGVGRRLMGRVTSPEMGDA